MTRIHRRTWQKGLNEPDNHDDVVTHLELDILECEVKSVLGSIAASKASGSDGILADWFKIQKLMLLKCCTQHVSKFGKFGKFLVQQWPQD